MDVGQIFETIMLVCFGFSWPLNVIKAYKARTVKGTSLAFIVLIITGYVAGITAKFINHQINYVLVVYFLNLAIVMTNVIVFFRNVALDNKKQLQLTKQKIFEIQQKYKLSTDKNSKEENMNYQEINKIAKLNGVILMGGNLDKQIPVSELAKSFDFNFDLYNRSIKNLSVKNAKDFFMQNVAPICPEGIIIHIGEEDLISFKIDSSEFDKYYLDLIESIKNVNKKCRIALVSVTNPQSSDVINNMNKHIKNLADSENAVFVNLDNAKAWTPKATQSASKFARNMGLSNRKPLLDVAEILYSYACIEMQEELQEAPLVG